MSDPKSGFYACENPLDVLKYCPPTCRFAVVKYDGNACGKLTIEKEIGLSELTSEAVKRIYTRVDLENKKIDGTSNRSVASNTGEQSVASNTGNYSVAYNAGDWSVASNTGEQSVAEVSGLHSVACALGTQSKAKASEGGAIVCVSQR